LTWKTTPKAGKLELKLKAVSLGSGCSTRAGMDNLFTSLTHNYGRIHVGTYVYDCVLGAKIAGVVSWLLCTIMQKSKRWIVGREERWRCATADDTTPASARLYEINPAFNTLADHTVTVAQERQCMVRLHWNG
jgi:hypothetical protein